MCMVIYKPRGAALDQALLDACALRNPHGSGYMFNDHGVICGIKGFMQPPDLYDSLERKGFLQGGQLASGRELVIHFRLATHGGIGPANCHPFPISSKIEDLKSLFWKAEMGLAHNGIIRTSQEESDLSDTQIFIRDVLSRLNLKHDLQKEATLTLIANFVRKSRLLFFRADGAVITMGHWVKQGNILFSNDI